MHWGPPARAIVFAMPLTLAILAADRGRPVRRAELGRGVPARRGAHADRPGGDLGGGDRAAGAEPRAPHAEPRVRAERRARAAVRALLPRAGHARRRRRAARALKLLGEAAFGAVLGVAFGILGGRAPPGGAGGRDHAALRGDLRGRARHRRLRPRRRDLRQRPDRSVRRRHRARRDRARDPGSVPRLRRERQLDLPGDDVLRLRRADRRHRLRRLDPGADRLHPARAPGRPAGRASPVARRDRLRAPRASVHGLVRAEGRRLDAVRADRARLRGRARLR